MKLTDLPNCLQMNPVCCVLSPTGLSRTWDSSRVEGLMVVTSQESSEIVFGWWCQSTSKLTSWSRGKRLSNSTAHLPSPEFSHTLSTHAKLWGLEREIITRREEQKGMPLWPLSWHQRFFFFFSKGSFYLLLLSSWHLVVIFEKALPT